MLHLDRLRQAAKTLKRDGLTLWFALRDPRTPWWVKALIAFVVGYALSPIDLIPDFIPVLGLVDDLILLPGLIWLALRNITADWGRAAHDWKAAMNQFAILYEDRFTQAAHGISKGQEVEP